MKSSATPTTTLARRTHSSWPPFGRVAAGVSTGAVTGGTRSLVMGGRPLSTRQKLEEVAEVLLAEGGGGCAGRQQVAEVIQAVTKQAFGPAALAGVEARGPHVLGHPLAGTVGPGEG